MFGRRRPQQQAPPAAPTLDDFARVVEKILQEIGVEPVQARMGQAEGYGWSFQRGSAIIRVFIQEQGGRGYFQVLSPIMVLPGAQLLPLYRYLLETNLRLTNGALGIHEDTVYVFSERLIDGLDAVEVNNIINLVSGYADELDNQLVNEFGGRLFSQI